MPAPSELFRRVAARWPFINDDWYEYARVMPELEPNRVKVAWLLSWGRSQAQIADVTRLHRSTVNYHEERLRQHLGVAERRDIGPMAGRLVDDLRLREGRLTLEIPVLERGDGADAHTPVKADTGGRPPRGTNPGAGRVPRRP
jgi:hypothetical protein